jgi:hypothetical protein
MNPPPTYSPYKIPIMGSFQSEVGSQVPNTKLTKHKGVLKSLTLIRIKGMTGSDPSFAFFEASVISSCTWNTQRSGNPIKKDIPDIRINIISRLLP